MNSKEEKSVKEMQTNTNDLNKKVMDVDSKEVIEDEEVTDKKVMDVDPADLDNKVMDIDPKDLDKKAMDIDSNHLEKTTKESTPPLDETSGFRTKRERSSEPNTPTPAPADDAFERSGMTSRRLGNSTTAASPAHVDSDSYGKPPTKKQLTETPSRIRRQLASSTSSSGANSTSSSSSTTPSSSSASSSSSETDRTEEEELTTKAQPIPGDQRPRHRLEEHGSSSSSSPSSSPSTSPTKRGLGLLDRRIRSRDEKDAEDAEYAKLEGGPDDSPDAHDAGDERDGPSDARSFRSKGILNPRKKGRRSMSGVITNPKISSGSADSSGSRPTMSPNTEAPKDPMISDPILEKASGEEVGHDGSSGSSDGSFQSPPSSSSSSTTASASGGVIRHRKDRHHSTFAQRYGRDKLRRDMRAATPSQMHETFLSDGEEPTYHLDVKSSPISEKEGESDGKGSGREETEVKIPGKAPDQAKNPQDSSSGAEGSSVNSSPDPSKNRTPSPPPKEERASRLTDRVTTPFGIFSNASYGDSPLEQPQYNRMPSMDGRSPSPTRSKSAAFGASLGSISIGAKPGPSPFASMCGNGTSFSDMLAASKGKGLDASFSSGSGSSASIFDSLDKDEPSAFGSGAKPLSQSKGVALFDPEEKRKRQKEEEEEEEENERKKKEVEETNDKEGQDEALGRHGMLDNITKRAPKVPQLTGEEGEETIIQFKAKLFANDPPLSCEQEETEMGGENEKGKKPEEEVTRQEKTSPPASSARRFRERGVGTIKLNRLLSDSSSLRLVMRADLTHRVILNVKILPEQDFRLQGYRLDFASNERADRVTSFALRMKNEDLADELYSTIREAQANGRAGVVGKGEGAV
ncbi:hypothetical protein BJ684DRAFT_16835 [Piptocephalis cylindrospora]|uniref:RanBD1 domain-containing protein n=1 Tax=Piptocephalis cylindrospora TaxID=1907219 RepID=A0A4V1IXY8_9FUNG|nr:hypothetical protein BJ684DRAFT_16835 [Piptocephalis cylindrospora]|eukprot:RKP12709.1 hypothetical protein BJ684DRAFT_16835 [Piptocephalis cylindrospora]